MARLSVPPATANAVLAALHPDPAQRPTGGCRAWLTSARGGLTSTVPSPVPLATGAGVPMPDPAGEQVDGASPSKPRRLRRIAATVGLSLTVTISATIAVVQNLDSGAGTEAATTASTDAATTTVSTTSTTQPTTTASSSTTRPLGGPITPGENFLADLDPVGDRWIEDSDLKIDGVSYLHGLRSPQMSACSSVTTEEVEYSVDRRFSTLNVVVGLSDESGFGLPVEVEIAGDGTPLWTGTVQVGQPQNLEIGVTNILRLRVTGTRLFDRRTTDCDKFYVALGDPALE
jgi:hypothetical protein